MVGNLGFVLAPDLAGRLLQHCLVARGDDDVGALRRKGMGHGATDTLGAAGDQDLFAFETEIHAVRSSTTGQPKTSSIPTQAPLGQAGNTRLRCIPRASLTSDAGGATLGGTTIREAGAVVWARSNSPPT